MRLPISSSHVLTLGFSLVCAVSISGCDKNQGNKAGTTAPAFPAAPVVMAASAVPPVMAPAMNEGKMSNVPVNGNEPLPPNHPSIAAMNPPHPSGLANEKANLDQQIAAQHPKSEGKKKLAIVVPDSIKGKWSAAKIAVTINGAEKEMKVAIGDKISLGNNVQIQVTHYFPAYTSDFKSATSSSNEQINPAIMVQAVANGKVVSEGWVFQNFPDFNSFKSEQVKVRLISGESAQKK
jgi:hypothetical protein